MALTELAASQSTSQEEHPPAEEPPERGRQRSHSLARSRRRRGWLLLSALLVAAVTWLIVELVSWLGATAPASGDAAVAAARTQALNLMTLNYKTATRDLQRVIDGSTGQMRDQYKQAMSGTASKVTGEKSVSTGTISSAGLVNLSGSTANVLVAGDATVAFPKSGKQPASRVQVHYRFQLQMQNVHGVWKSAVLNFAGLPNVTELPAS